MLTDAEIQNLIKMPKLVVSKTPGRGYAAENNQRRCSLELVADGDPDKQFTIFIRQNTNFIENFSIGLRYRTGNKRLPIVTLIRYNGAHGEYDISPDGHFIQPHIHRMTEEELKSGSIQPQESCREITDRYETFEQALGVFLGDVAASNLFQYFPELQQQRLFNGHWQN